MCFPNKLHFFLQTETTAFSVSEKKKQLQQLKQVILIVEGIHFYFCLFLCQWLLYKSTHEADYIHSSGLKVNSCFFFVMGLELTTFQSVAENLSH